VSGGSEKGKMTHAIPQFLIDRMERIAAPDPRWRAAARDRLDHLTKPLGSLGMLESIAEQVAAIFRGEMPMEFRKAAYIFAADHGVVAEGVSLYPAEVTAQMVHNFAAGGAAINVLCRAHGCRLTVVDAGVNGDLARVANVVHCKVRMGSRNMAREAAMTEEELTAALQVGVMLADQAHADGENLVALGEMGIGNTTSASAITAMLTGLSPAVVTGSGTGLDEDGRRRKASVIEGAIRLHFGASAGSGSAIEILRCLGGLEIAAMTGFYLGGAAHGMALVCDGFISTAAAAIAAQLAPQIKAHLFAGHRSEEPGHRILLERLGLEPILQLRMRLGEGSGAVLAMPVLESAAALYREMATFSSAGVSEAQ
jgi:nicotinate-nucleotide--dimethylbenzimidazole phosphoribosyltransferase